MSTNKYTLDELRSILKILWSDPTLPGAILIGPPGSGKSTMIEELAREMGMPCETMMANIRDPSDFAGLPVARDGQVDMLPLDWARRIAGTRCVLFLDEINTARPATIAALLRVALDRIVGNVHLGSEVRIVAAMNPAEESAHGWELPPALANRFYHFTLADTPVTAWKSWAAEKAHGDDVLAALVDKFDVESMHQPATCGPFASPRAWFNALRAAAGAERAGRPELAFDMVQAAVGTGAAIAWSQQYSAIMDWGIQHQPDTVRRTLVRELEALKLDSSRAEHVWYILDQAAEHNAATTYVVMRSYQAVLEPHTLNSKMAAQAVSHLQRKLADVEYGADGAA